MATINCCIVGYGGIAEFHAEALAQIADTRIHSIVGRREEPSGAFATINLSYNARQPANGNRYLCENGVLEVNGKSVSFNGEEVFQTSENPESGVVVQDRDFIDAIREDREPTCNADEALKSMIVLQQVYDQMITMEGEEKYKRRWKE